MRPILASILCAVALATLPLFMFADNNVLAASLLQSNDGSEYVVQPGDTLSQIAGSELGDVDAWQQILDATNARAQEDDSFETISDATLIEVGQRLWIPDGESTAAADEADEADEASAEPAADATSSSAEDALFLIPQVEEGGRLFGYIDQTGAFQIEPGYVIARRFSEGLAAVSKDGLRFGYINTAGEMVIPPQFWDAGPFSGGLAPAQAGEPTPLIPIYDFEQDQVWEIYPSGYIDQSGDFAITPEYAYAEPFIDGVAVVWDGGRKRSFLNLDGDLLLQPREASATALGTIFRSELAASSEREGLCENNSSFGEHATFWSCRVDDELFDPCFAQESPGVDFGCELNDEGLMTCGQQPEPALLVCGYPLSPFVAANIDPDDLGDEPSTLDDTTIPGYWLQLAGDDGIECMLIAQDSLEGASPQIYVCSDGTFIVDEPWMAVGYGNVWMARTVELSGIAPDYEFVESSVSVIDEIREYSTSSEIIEPTDNTIPPPFPSEAYWQH